MTSPSPARRVVGTLRLAAALVLGVALVFQIVEKTVNNDMIAGQYFSYFTILTTISGIEPERALAELRYHLDEPDWAVWAVQILAARIEWFIDPEDWTSQGELGAFLE